MKAKALLAVLIFSLVGLPQVFSQPKDDILIAGILFKDEFTMKMVAQGYKDAAQELGVKIVIGNSMGDVANEQQLIYSYVDMGAKGIAITPYSESASVAALREANKKGVQIATANLDLSKSASFICGGFTSDDYTNGYSLGTFSGPYLKKLYGKLNIAILDFNAAIPAQSMARYGGFLDALKKQGIEYKIVAQQSSTSKQDNIPIVEAMLNGAPSCNVFYNTSMAFTSVVTQTVMNMGLADKITVIGYDMGEQVATQILDKKSPLYCTLEQDMYKMGYNAVKQLVQTIRGEKTLGESGKGTFVPGRIYSKADPKAVNDWLDYYKVISSKR
jgi:ABC-type sugar transport system substrate-binding protein